MLSVTLKLLILSVITLSVVMLSVMAPTQHNDTKHNDSQDSIQHNTKKCYAGMSQLRHYVSRRIVVVMNVVAPYNAKNL
jgi:hypothetical protein